MLICLRLLWSYGDINKFAVLAFQWHTWQIYSRKCRRKFYQRLSYSRTVPSLVSYPDLKYLWFEFEEAHGVTLAVGDLGGNALPDHTNGTPLTDTLYGVRYYMTIERFLIQKKWSNPEKMYFHRFTNRFDLGALLYRKSMKTSDLLSIRTQILSFPLGYVNALVKNIKFGWIMLSQTKNIILNSMEERRRKRVIIMTTFKPLALVPLKNVIREK